MAWQWRPKGTGLAVKNPDKSGSACTRALRATHSALVEVDRLAPGQRRHTGRSQAVKGRHSSSSLPFALKPPVKRGKLGTEGGEAPVRVVPERVPDPCLRRTAPILAQLNSRDQRMRHMESLSPAPAAPVLQASPRVAPPTRRHNLSNMLIHLLLWTSPIS